MADVVDPRPVPIAADELTVLAPRPVDLTGRTVCLFDNGKLAPRYGEYAVVFDICAELVEQQHGTVRRSGTDLLDNAVDQQQIVHQLLADGIELVILAICDWGVSQKTVLLAAKLEAAGLPCAVIALRSGADLARSTADASVPAVPIFSLDVPRWASRDRIAEHARPSMAALVSTLTGSSPAPEASRGAPARSGPPDGSGLLSIDGSDASREFTRIYADYGIGDGLPLFAPFVDDVAHALSYAGLTGGEQVWPVTHPRRTPVTSKDVSAISVMAGCRPAALPAVLAGYRSMADPQFQLSQAAVTTHPGGSLVLYSGPATEQLGLISGRGALGPTPAANTAVGRALALSYSVLLDARAGATSLVSQGTPAQLSYCCAEALDDSPWPGLNADLRMAESTIGMAWRCEAPHLVLDSESLTAESLLTTFASVMATLGGNNAYVLGAQTAVLLNPEHAHFLADQGLSKQDVQQELFERARIDASELVGRGIAPIRPPEWAEAERMPIAASADDIVIFVTGGRGPNSQVAIPWGYSRAVPYEVQLPETSGNPRTSRRK